VYKLTFSLTYSIAYNNRRVAHTCRHAQSLPTAAVMLGRVTYGAGAPEFR